MPTQWFDYAIPGYKKPSWLLMDGSILDCPALETSGSHRRVRLKYHPEVSGWLKDIDKVLLEGADHIADIKGTRVWMQTGAEIGSGNHEKWPPPKLFFVEDPAARYGECAAKWLFEHPSYPEVKAFLRIAIKGSYGQKELSATLHYPSTSPTDKEEPTVKMFPTRGTWSLPTDYNTVFFQNLRPTDDLDWEVTKGKHYRPLVELFIGQVQKAMGLETIRIPDLRDPEKPGWIELTNVHTNVNSEFLQDVADFLDNGSALVEAREAFQEFRTALRRAGIVLDDVSEEAMNAMLSGKHVVLTPEIKPVLDENGEDNQHEVHFNLATGAITVACSAKHASPQDAVEAWNLARFEAEMKGELDSFLGHTKTVLQKNGDREAKKLFRSIR